MSSTHSSSAYEDSNSSDTSLRSSYNISALCIFIVMSYTFLFPCNQIIPLDRRTVAVLCAVLCYITRAYAFHGRTMNIVEAVDFDVLVLLASIMAINHLIVHLKETKKVIQYLQRIIQEHPERGFWMVSIAAMVVSPFLTNDGVCLLFVEPILDAFEGIVQNPSEIDGLDGSIRHEEGDNQNRDISTHSKVDRLTLDTSMMNKKNKLEPQDAMYFMLNLACSANIGSALTYTGNPQNMIVAQDALTVMPSYMFTAYMFLPTIAAWLLTTLWIRHCWNKAKAVRMKENSSAKDELAVFIPESQIDRSYDRRSPHRETLAIDTNDKVSWYESLFGSKKSNALSPLTSAKSSPTSPRRRKIKKGDQGSDILNNVVYVLSSPIPYLVLILFVAMIILIFVDVMSISGLVCVSAIVMVISVVIGNHWRGQSIWTIDSAHLNHLDDDVQEDYIIGKDQSSDLRVLRQPLTDEQKIDDLNEFFEGLFNSLDYSLLFIFLGTFIVVANLDSTGIPKTIWDRIVGRIPFKSFSSVVSISLFVVIASQFLGNVAIVQLAKPNVETLGDQEKKYAWAVISFVATVGGNLTLTGSAANIIVCEKCAKIDPNSKIDFWSHLNVCFLVTAFVSTLGGALITVIMHLESLL